MMKNTSSLKCFIVVVFKTDLNELMVSADLRYVALES